MTDVGEVVRLDEKHRVLWIRTILAMHGSEPQRHAFIAGYNRDGRPRGSLQMRANHALGAEVSALLQEAWK